MCHHFSFIGGCTIFENLKNDCCESCFAVTSLRRMDFKDDIYFKIWRAIPTEVNGNVPPVPSVDPETYPNRGQIIHVDENGAIISASPVRNSKTIRKILKGPNFQNNSDSSDVESVHGDKQSKFLYYHAIVYCLLIFGYVYCLFLQ